MIIRNVITPVLLSFVFLFVHTPEPPSPDTSKEIQLAVLQKVKPFLPPSTCTAIHNIKGEVRHKIRQTAKIITNKDSNVTVFPNVGKKNKKKVNESVPINAKRRLYHILISFRPSFILCNYYKFYDRCYQVPTSIKQVAYNDMTSSTATSDSAIVTITDPAIISWLGANAINIPALSGRLSAIATTEASNTITAPTPTTKIPGSTAEGSSLSTSSTTSASTNPISTTDFASSSTSTVIATATSTTTMTVARVSMVTLNETTISTRTLVIPRFITSSKTTVVYSTSTSTITETLVSTVTPTATTKKATSAKNDEVMTISLHHKTATIDWGEIVDDDYPSYLTSLFKFMLKAQIMIYYADVIAYQMLHRLYRYLVLKYSIFVEQFNDLVFYNLPN